MKILILGDVMGSSGRKVINSNLSNIIKKYKTDFRHFFRKVLFVGIPLVPKLLYTIGHVAKYCKATDVCKSGETAIILPIRIGNFTK